eukprot:gene17963-21436_t
MSSSLSLFIVLLLLSLAYDHGVESAPPTTLVSIVDARNFTVTSLATGELLLGQRLPQDTYITSLLQCSGDDYIFLISGTFESGPNNYNISVYNSVSQTLTTKESFYLLTDKFIDYQLNTIDLASGLAFSTYCPRRQPILAIFDMNKQSAVNIEFTNAKCDIYAYGVYDVPNQIYYVITDQFGPSKYLYFSLYNVESQSITYTEIPYVLGDEATFQQIFIYQSVVYVCILQNTYAEIVAIDFATKTTDSIFKMDMYKIPLGSFAFSPSGYILALLFSSTDRSLFNVLTVDLATNLYTNNTIPMENIGTVSSQSF